MRKKKVALDIGEKNARQPIVSNSDLVRGA
jgi:hypothetical protein